MTYSAALFGEDAAGALAASAELLAKAQRRKIARLLDLARAGPSSRVLPDGWVISARPAHPALVSEADFIAAQDIRSARGPAAHGDLAVPKQRQYLLAGLLACGACGRRMESAWSNGKPAYRCRHGHTSAAPPDPARPKNAHIREDRVLPHLPALHLLLAGAEPAARRRRRTRRGAGTRPQAGPEDVIGYLRERGITLTYDPAAGTLQADTAKTLIRKAS
jgi:site-specific DNA recombinase